VLPSTSRHPSARSTKLTRGGGTLIESNKSVFVLGDTTPRPRLPVTESSLNQTDLFPCCMNKLCCSLVLVSLVCRWLPRIYVSAYGGVLINSAPYFSTTTSATSHPHTPNFQVPSRTSPPPAGCQPRQAYFARLQHSSPARNTEWSIRAPAFSHLSARLWVGQSYCRWQALQGVIKAVETNSQRQTESTESTQSDGIFVTAAGRRRHPPNIVSFSLSCKTTPSRTQI
jgi:hypothetical protein